MINRLVCLVALAALAQSLAGCGASCESICDDKDDNNCGIATCKDVCARDDKLTEDADCEEQYDDFISCTDDHPDDLCSVTAKPCQTEQDALDSCLKPHCEANPAADGCTS